MAERFLIYELDAPGLDETSIHLLACFDPNIRRISQARRYYDLARKKFNRKETLQPILEEKEPDDPILKKIYRLISEIEMEEIDYFRSFTHKVIKQLKGTFPINGFKKIGFRMFRS